MLRSRLVEDKEKTLGLRFSRLSCLAAFVAYSRYGVKFDVSMDGSSERCHFECKAPGLELVVSMKAI
jgi:hypothetical protein